MFFYNALCNALYNAITREEHWPSSRRRMRGLSRTTERLVGWELLERAQSWFANSGWRATVTRAHGVASRDAQRATMAPKPATPGGPTDAVAGAGTGMGLESRLGAMALRYLQPNPAVLDQFEQHASRMRDASRARKRSVAFRNVVDDRDDHEVASVVDTLGKPMPSDVYEGDTHLRTLRTLLSMIDERGWERCANLCRATSTKPASSPAGVCYSPASALSTGLHTK